MSYALRMIETSPAKTGWDPKDLAEAIEALGACAQACTACADACLGEESARDLRRCITVDLNCADVCTAAAAVLSRQTSYDSGFSAMRVRACIEACRICAAECEGHASMHQHCGVCAEACRGCAEACSRLVAA